MNNEPKPIKYDLEERTFQFSKSLIILCKTLKVTLISKPLIDQLIRSGTSVGANYTEANVCDSKKDFMNKVLISRKESKEVLYWLRLLAIQFPENKDSLRLLWKEAHEISLIMGGILKSAKRNAVRNYKP